MKKFIATSLIFCLTVLCSCANVETTKKTVYDKNGMPYDSITITGPGASVDENLVINSNTDDGKIERIEIRAFLKCDQLTSVKINDVPYICNNAFAECANLKSVEIYNCNIGANAFYNCDKLETVYINQCIIENSAFKDCDNLKNVIIKGNHVSSVNDFCSIRDSAFESCDNLENLTIENGSDIGKNAFAYCKNLKTVTIGFGDIEDSAFSGCSSLKTVTTGGGDIGSYVFSPNLESLTIQSSYGCYIDAQAFWNNDSHLTINYPGTKKDFESYISGLNIWGGLASDGGVTVKCTNGTLYYN